MGITTRQFGPNAKGSKLTTAEMDENFNYLNDYGVIATTNEYYVLAGFSGDSPSDGSKASPYPSVAAAISAADADGHTNSNPAFIILLSTITEDVTITQGGIWITTDYGTGTHGSIILNGTITINGDDITLLKNHFSISNLRIVAPIDAPGVLFTGTNPQRLYMRDLWIDADGTTGSCIYADNTGTGSVCHLNTAHLIHRGSGDVYCFDAESGSMYLTDIEAKSGANVMSVKVASGATLTLDSSEIDVRGEAAIEVHGGILTVTRSTISNAKPRTYGIACITSGSVVTITDCLFNIDPDADGKAVFGAGGTASDLYYQYIAFSPDSNRGISAGTITATPLETTFA